MSRANFLDRTLSKSNGLSHRRAKKQEKMLAKRGEGRLTPGSGNQAIKGDVRNYSGIFRVEAKTTRNKQKSFSVTVDMIRKIEESAIAHNEVPAMIVEIWDEENRKYREIAILPTEHLRPELLGITDAEDS